MLEGQGSSRMQLCCFVRLSSMFGAHVLLLSSESGMQSKLLVASSAFPNLV